MGKFDGRVAIITGGGKGGGKPALWQGRVACAHSDAEREAARIFSEAGL